MDNLKTKFIRKTCVKCAAKLIHFYVYFFMWTSRFEIYKLKTAKCAILSDFLTFFTIFV